MANFAFNAADVNPSSSFEPIPAGKYNALIEASEIKPTSKGDGKRLNLTFTVIGGEFNNRKIFEGLNIENKNAEAQRISLENLSAICHAIGVMNLTNTEQLHNKPMTIKVGIKAGDGNYDARNVIKGYEAASGATGTTQRPASGGGQQRPTGGGVQRPAAQQGQQQARGPAQQSSPARGPAAAQGGGRPAGANAPVRQQPAQQQAPAPQQEPEQQYADNDYVEPQANGDEGFDPGFDPNSAPWDN